MSKRMIDSELIEALGTDIKFDGTGNVIVGKNLEVGGTTKLNGGIKPIHTFTWSINQDGMQWDYTLESLYETEESSLGYTIFNGYLRIHVNGVDISQDYAIIGEYNGFGGQINELNGITFGGYPVLSIVDGTNLELFSYNSTTNKATFTKYALTDKTQSKLYRHKITLNGTYVLMYNSTSNISVGSVTDLRTVMNIKSESNEEILPVCASDATAMVTLVVTTSLCQVDGSDVTTVSDVVTAL